MKNPKVGKVKTDKQIIYHVTAPMSGQFLKSRSENGDHFLSPTFPKNGGIDFCLTKISFSGEFWANFENRVF